MSRILMNDGEDFEKGPRRRVRDRAAFLNRSQKVALLLGTLVFVAMGLFPPYRAYLKPGEVYVYERFVGYAWIGMGPSVPARFLTYERAFLDGWDDRVRVTIDRVQLTVQWVTIATATLAVLVLLSGPRSPRNPKRQTDDSRDS